MNTTEARELAVTIVDSWPGQRAVETHVWVDELVELDLVLACQTLTRLRREHSRPPTVAGYLEMYRAVRRAAEPPSTEQQQSDDDEAITFDEYVRRLTRRAASDPAAADELARWAKWRPHKGIVPALRLIDQEF